MRYASTENTVLAGIFDPGSTVNIKVINMENDSLVDITSNVCTESSNMPGIFLWSTSNINEVFSTNTNLLYQMYDTIGKTFVGKFVYSGILDEINTIKTKVSTVETNTRTILDIEQGTWEIKNKQMIFYDPSGIEIMRFDLLDKHGNPTDTNVYTRKLV